MSTGTEVVLVETTEHLADKINICHRAVIDSGKTMLAYAANAGRMLIAVKGMLKHGEFKPWIEKNCAFSYERAKVYMRVSKKVACDPFEIDQSIDAFLGVERKPSTPHPTPTVFTHVDAEHALKLHVMAIRGATEAERDVAGRKLESFAATFGRMAGDIVFEAQDILPDYEKTAKQVRVEKAEAEAQAAKAEAATLRAQLEAIQSRINQLRTDCMGMTREALEEAYIGLVLEREGLTKISKKAA